MTVVLFLGDTHGSKYTVCNAVDWAAKNNVDRIVQVGDFGYWPRTNNGQDFLKECGRASVKAHVPLYFIDGNHEDHDMLDDLRLRGSGMIHFGKYPITYIDRGTSWEWGGVRFGAFGGAFSIDRSRRVLHSGRYGWFRNEVPDESKISALGAVDVLITHDSPIIPPDVYSMGHFVRDATSEESQASVYRAMVATGCRHLIHGHWHMYQQYRVGNVTVQALDRDGTSLYRHGVVFDTGTRNLYTIQQWEYRDT